MIDSRQRNGFSLIELMVAMVLGLIMLGAIGAIYMSSKRTYSTTETLSRSQESARFASQFAARELRMAGYNNIFESGLVTRSLVFPAVGTTFAAGQVIAGVNNSAGTGTVKAGTDTVSYRYGGNTAGAVRDCTGTAVAAGLPTTVVLFISDTNQLTCTVNGGADQPLVEGIADMQLEYGVDTDADRAANTYLAANSVTNWLAVVSVRVILGVAGSNDVTPGNTDVDRRTVDSVVAMRNQLP